MNEPPESGPERSTQGTDAERPVLSAVALVGQLGLVVSLSVVAGVLCGIYLDTRFETGGLLLVLMIFLGIGSGIYGAYRLIAKEMGWNA
ncbi:MAG: AtpZ/AtpI family protein [bacterium]|nr:AtpZ/AtpI family protein [bacterium]